MIYTILLILVSFTLWHFLLKEVVRAGKKPNEDSFWDKWPGRMLFQQNSGEPIANSPYFNQVRHNLIVVAVLTVLDFPVLGVSHYFGGLNIHQRMSFFDYLAISNMELNTQLDIAANLFVLFLFLFHFKTRPEITDEEIRDIVCIAECGVVFFAENPNLKK